MFLFSPCMPFLLPFSPFLSPSPPFISLPPSTVLSISFLFLIHFVIFEEPFWHPFFTLSQIAKTLYSATSIERELQLYIIFLPKTYHLCIDVTYISRLFLGINQGTFLIDFSTKNCTQRSPKCAPRTNGRPKDSKCDQTSAQKLTSPTPFPTSRP